MDGPFGGEAHDEEVMENWLARHRSLYDEDSCKSQERRRQGRKKRKRKGRKGGRPKKRVSPPTIKVRSDRRRVCPNCQNETMADTITGGKCIPCQVFDFYQEE